MANACVFSADRRHRYTLIHRWDDLLTPAGPGIAWICLNPSTADENQLDPTLRRIRGFSPAWGDTHFIMLNAFAYRATDPADMKAAADPVGPDNDHWIAHWAGQVDRVMLGWGEHGAHLGRHERVLALLDPAKAWCLACNASGQPKHPLYVAQRSRPRRYP
jgi:hypothetical protein